MSITAKLVLYVLPLVPLTVSASIHDERTEPPRTFSWLPRMPEPVVEPPSIPRASPRSQAQVEKQVAPAREMVQVNLVNANNLAEKLTVTLPVDGMVDPETQAVLKDFFRCRRSQRQHAMSAGVLSLLADLAKKFPGHEIEIISGYRARPYGAPKSKHFKGNAIDLRVRGVKLSRVRDAMWVSHHHMGLGWYPEANFIHVDFRPDEPGIAWSARGEGSPYRYHPGWAYKARKLAKGAESSEPAKGAESSDQLASR